MVVSRTSRLRRLLLGTSTAIAAVALAVSAAAAFTDVADPHPYGPAIEELSDRAIINGFADGTFGPDLPVKRQQFAKMIVLTLDLPVTEADVPPFSDVDVGGPSTLYPDNYVAVVAARGITNGTSPTTFSPFADITRAQVVTMIVRASQNVIPGTLTTPPAEFTGTVGNALGHWSDVHARNMQIAEWNGLLNGLVGFGLTWDPWAPASRGEVAQMLFRLLALMSPPTTSTSASSTTTTASSTTTTASSTTTTASSTTTTVSSTTTTLSGGQVAINGFAFSPAALTVDAGTTVTWRNNHAFSHSVVADDLSFSSGLLTNGASFSHTFDQPGVYTYHCGVHPLIMTGTITVL